MRNAASSTGSVAKRLLADQLTVKPMTGDWQGKNAWI